VGGTGKIKPQTRQEQMVFQIKKNKIELRDINKRAKLKYILEENVGKLFYEL
jgi:hypothetical protein